MARYMLSTPQSMLLTKPTIQHSSSSSDSFPIIVIAVIGIFSTTFLLVSYYVFVIKCCLNWHRIDLLGPFSVTRTRNTSPVPSSLSSKLEESVIRSIPILKFKTGITKTKYVECAVCLSEFREDEKLRIIPNCAHVFHLECIDVWFQSSADCPLCRRSISSAALMEVPISSPSPVLDEYRVDEMGDDGTSENPFERLIIPLPTRRKFDFVVQMSLGDECIEMNRKKEDEFGCRTEGMRRSFSFDSLHDTRLVQLIQQQKSTVRRDLNYEDCSSSRIRRSLFSLCHVN